MADATFSQVNQLFQLIARDPDSKITIQWLNEHWGVIQSLINKGLDQATLLALLDKINPYSNEKTEPKFFYPEGYKPKTVEEQVAVLLAYYPWLDVSRVAEYAAGWQMPSGADGLYVVPKPTALAAHLGIVEDHWDNFGLLIEQGPLAALASSQRQFSNYRLGQMGKEHYRLSEGSKKQLLLLEESQDGDVLVLLAQTGLSYAGFSVRNARSEIEQKANPAEWPLPAYVVGWMMYSNPHRLEKYEHLAIDCPGDEYSFGADGRFDDALGFRFGLDGLRFGGRFVDGVYGYFGSASGFVR